MATRLWNPDPHFRLSRRRLAFQMALVLFASFSVSVAAEPRVPPLPVDRLPAELKYDAVPLGLEFLPPAPDDHQLTPQRVQLGRKLFFDPLLSADKSMSCASCHPPEHGFAGREARAVGVEGKLGTRNAPSVLNRAYGTAFFWDGRADSLEEQALKPIENPLELAHSVEKVVATLNADGVYQKAFDEAYGGPATAENLSRALASFQRVLLSGNSRVDRFFAGDASALSTAERQGLWLYESRGRCWKCHTGHNFTDELFHNTGVSWQTEPLDLGQEKVTGNVDHRGRFKTPTLRDVGRTAPYMHDGSLATLKEVVEFYNQGGRENPHLDPVVAPLGLSPKDVDHLVAFLKALNGKGGVFEGLPQDSP